MLLKAGSRGVAVQESISYIALRLKGIVLRGACKAGRR
jgi:hypothetical protein